MAFGRPRPPSGNPIHGRGQMTGRTLDTQQLALSDRVREAINDVVLALADTAQFRAFDEAEEALDADSAAQQAIADLQSQRQQLQMMLALNNLSEQEQTDFRRVEEACFGQPTVAAYVASQEELAGVAVLATDRISEPVGIDYAAACGAACGCGGPDITESPDDYAEDTAVITLLSAAQRLGEAVRAAEPLQRYHNARAGLSTDAEAYDLLQRLADVSAKVRLKQAHGDVSREDIVTLRALQEQLRHNAAYQAFVEAQSAAVAYLKSVNQTIAESLGFDWITLVQSRTC
jgi:cell fate (sporulation/competence/biofilm development) regulator YlbF (YheA/YmcA/DUF963 family)